MKTIENYLAALAKEIKKLHGDVTTLEEYRSHITESYQAFIQKQIDLRLNDSELENLFVDQLEPVKIIARSLLGLETEKLNTYEYNPKAQLGRDINLISNDLRNSISEQKNRIKSIYLNHRSPPLTALVYLFYSAFILIGAIFLGLILPDVSSVSCNDGPFFIHFGNPNSISCPVTGKNTGSLSTAPILIPVLGLVALILIFIMLIRFGYKNNTKYSVITGICLSLFVIPLDILNETSFFITNQILTYNQYDLLGNTISWAGTQDWNVMNPFSLKSVGIILIYISIRGFILIFGYILLPIFLGVLIKVLMRDFKIINTKKIKHISMISLLLVINLSLIVITPTLTYSIPTTPMPSPLSDNYPLVYSINTASTTANYTVLVGSLNTLNVSLPKSLGKILFMTGAFFNITINKNTFEDTTPKFTACISKILSSCESRNTQTILGTYFFPVNQTPDYLTKLNSSFPFPGYKPSLNNNVYAVHWQFDNSNLINDHSAEYLNVTTIDYTSETNNSLFTFSFDKKTGFLLEAKLTLFGGTWISGLEMNVLTIQRAFTINTIQNPGYFSDIQLIQDITVGSFILGCYGLLAILFYYYEKRVKELELI